VWVILWKTLEKYPTLFLFQQSFLYLEELLLTGLVTFVPRELADFLRLGVRSS
jgi:hypothetical protein